MKYSKAVLVSILGIACACVAYAGKSTNPWGAFVPPADENFDWVQLPSGEWLKGDVKVMYDYTLEFDSDELGLQELDFEDIKQLRTRRPQTVKVEKGRRDTELVHGKLDMKGDKIIMHNGIGDVEVERSRVISIAGGARRGRDNWSGNASLGLTLRGGNAETMDITAMANIKRRTAITRLNVDYLSNYSEADNGDPTIDNKTADNQRLNGYFDWFLTSRLYWQVLAAEYYRDPFINVAEQYSVSTGVGYDLIRSARTEWTVNVGAGYQETKFDIVTAPDPDSADSAFGSIGTRLDYEITGDIDFLYDYGARFLSEDNGQYTHHMVASLSFEFIGDLDLDVSAIWDRIEKPQATDLTDPTTIPEQDDYRLVIGLAYDF